MSEVQFIRLPKNLKTLRGKYVSILKKKEWTTNSIENFWRNKYVWGLDNF